MCLVWSIAICPFGGLVECYMWVWFGGVLYMGLVMSSATRGFGLVQCYKWVWFGRVLHEGLVWSSATRGFGLARAAAVFTPEGVAVSPWRRNLINSW